MHHAVLCSHLFHTVSVVFSCEISPYDMEGLIITGGGELGIKEGNAPHHV